MFPRMVKPSIFDVASLKANWDRLAAIPGGKLVFSRAIGLMAPYSSTIGARVIDLRDGYARVEMRESRKVRNHLRSVHAAALFNLAELTGNLAIIARLPSDARMIPTNISIEYVKKARGRLIAIGEAPPIPSSERKEYEATVRIENAAGEEVARARVRSLVGPRES